MHIGEPEPIVRVYEGTFGSAEREYEADRTRMNGAGYEAEERSRVVHDRKFMPDITRIEVRYVYPPVEDGWTGVRLVGNDFEVAWNDSAEAKYLIKELRLMRKELVALKRTETGDATMARRRVRGAEAKAKVAAPYVLRAEQYELRIRGVDTALRQMEGWLLRGDPGSM